MWVDFGGVHMARDGWINGRHLGYRPNGYVSFRYDLTPHLVEGANVLAVRVDNSRQPASRWYTGAGVYRRVTLIVAGPLHVDHWGTYVTTPEVTPGGAVVNVRTWLMSHDANLREVVLKTTIVSPDSTSRFTPSSTARPPKFLTRSITRTTGASGLGLLSLSPVSQPQMSLRYQPPTLIG